MKNNLDLLSLEKIYAGIMQLKKALGIDRRIETSRSAMLDTVREHNTREVFLLEFIMDSIKSMPPRAEKFFEDLILQEDSDNFPEYYAEAEKLLKTDKVLKDFCRDINKELELNLASSRYYFNFIVYETAYNEIGLNSIFSAKSPIMNLYLMKKWLKKYENMQRRVITSLEKSILSLLMDGCLLEEIISYPLIENKSPDTIRREVFQIMPAMFDAESMIQVLAVYMYKYDIKKELC